MLILPNLLRSVFVWILAIQTFNISSLNAARACTLLSEQEKDIFTFDLAVTKKMLLAVKIMNQNCNKDIRNLILSDLIWLHKITRLADYLKKKAAQNDLKAIFSLINHLFVTYNHDISVFLLKAALDEAKLSISDIRDWNGYSLFHTICVSYKNWNHCLKIILSTAGDKALDMLLDENINDYNKGTEYIINHIPWHYDLITYQDDIVDIYMAHFIDDKSKEALLSKQSSGGKSALHLTANNNHSSIFEKLLKFASTTPGLISKLLAMKTSFGKTVEDMAQDQPEILDIINFYCVKHDLVKFFDFQ